MNTDAETFSAPHRDPLESVFIGVHPWLISGLVRWPGVCFVGGFTMAKIEVNKVAEILKKNQVDPAVLRRIVEEMNLAAQPEPGDEEKPPAMKKQFVILVSDPEGRMPKHDFVGWVLQIPENESVATTEERLFRGAYDFNASKKGRLMPVKTVGEAIENVAAKYFKEADVFVKTKTPVLVLKTDNEIPKDTSNKRE